MNENLYPFYHFSLDFFKKEFRIEGAKYIHSYIETFKKERELFDNKNYEIIIVEEKRYVDAFFLKDYAKYYVEAIARKNKMTQRLHFFLLEKSEEEFVDMLLRALSTGEQKIIDTLNSLYIGFITIKPIPNEKGKKSLGKCFLRPYPSNNGKRHYVVCKGLECSLGGIRFVIDTIPFHQQDIAVGACASATLWMAQFPINEYFSVPIRSLAEITQISSYPYRRAPLYPNDGLQIEEVNKYLIDLGLQFHTIELKVLYENYKKQFDKKSANFIVDSLLRDTIRSYIGIGFPIIAILSLTERKRNIMDINKKTNWHAALITGYRLKNEEINEIYIHDDRICPYSRAFLEDTRDVLRIKNEWEKDHHYKTNFHLFTIPVPPILRFTITQVYDYLIRILLEEEVICPIPLLKDLKRWKWPNILLYSVNEYKGEILPIKIKKCNVRNCETNEIEEKTKIEFLTQNCPKYLWILRFQKEGNTIVKDVILDATLSTPEILAEVRY